MCMKGRFGREDEKTVSNQLGSRELRLSVHAEHAVHDRV